MKAEYSTYEPFKKKKAGMQRYKHVIWVSQDAGTRFAV
jgi:hypothetical protein